MFPPREPPSWCGSLWTRSIGSSASKPNPRRNSREVPRLPLPFPRLLSDNHGVKSILKSLLAILLGLGFLALQSRAQAPAAASAKKAAIAFLGLTDASDPQMRAVITQRIRGELAADTALITIPGETVDK